MSLTVQKVLVGVLTLALAAALVFAGQIDRQRRPATAPDSGAVAAFVNPQLARGREAFIKYSCNACHGTSGRGGIRNLNAESGGEVNGLLHVAESYTADELAEKIQKGVPDVGKSDPTGPSPPLKMPAYGDLVGGTELKDLVAYVMSLGGGGAKREKKSEW
jgi:mono/diheme cytochrome c family protein